MWHCFSLQLLVMMSLCYFFIGTTFSMQSQGLTSVFSLYQNDQYFEDITLYRGVLDRIEDERLAVILIEDMNKEIVLPILALPKGSKEGIWLLMTFEPSNNEWIITIDDDKTNRYRKKSFQLMETLRLK